MYSRIRAAATDVSYNGYYPIKREQVMNRVDNRATHPNCLVGIKERW